MWRLFLCLILVAILVTLSVIILSKNRSKDKMYFDVKFGSHNLIQSVKDPLSISSEDSIDAVITWLDTTCPIWIRAKESVFNSDQYSNAISVFDESKRFPSNEFTDAELSLCLSLILKNLPWIRCIFIVCMSPQHPKCLKQNRFSDAVMKNKIVIIHHDEIFPNPSEQLPTFNSHAIESCIHRIPRLSEKFLYFNDDFFVIRPLERTEFYDKGKTLHSVSAANSTNLRLSLPFVAEDGWICAWLNLLDRKEKFGLENIVNIGHVPHPLTIKMMIEAEKHFHTQWKISSNHKIRGACSDPDIPPIGATINLALENGLAAKGSIMEYAIHDGNSPNLDNLIENNPQVVCLNNIPHEHVGREIMKMTRWFCPDVPGCGSDEYTKPGFVPSSLMIIANPGDEVLFGLNNGLGRSTDAWAVLCFTFGNLDNSVKSIVRKNEFAVSMSEYNVNAWKMIDLPILTDDRNQFYLKWCIDTYLDQIQSTSENGDLKKISKIACYGCSIAEGNLHRKYVFEAAKHVATHAFTNDVPKRHISSYYKRRISGLYESKAIQYNEHDVIRIPESIS